jgi:DNA-binding SARP family transcriptional activator
MANAKIELYMLGAPEVRRNGQPVNFDTRKALALLAYLAVNERSQSRDTLAALLWGELDQFNARASLRRTLSTLKKGLEGTGLAIERETLTLESGPEFWADVIEFNQNLKVVKAQLAKDRKIDAASVSRLETVIALWRGEFMQGFSLRDSPEFEEWQSQVAENFQREMAWSLEKLVCWYAASHIFDKALDYARRWLALDPLNEETYCQIMQFYAWSGNWEYLRSKPRRRCTKLLKNAASNHPNLSPQTRSLLTIPLPQ